MQNKLKLILVDIDGTLMRGSMESVFFRFLRSQKRVSWIKVALSAVAILLSSGWPRWHKVKVAYLRGLSPRDVSKWAEECFEAEIVPMLYEPLGKALGELKADGLEIVLLSGTVDFLAELMGRHFGIQQYVASEPEIQNEVYSGGLKERHPYGKRKVAFAEGIVARVGSEWASTGAIADNYADRFLLQQVAVAVVVKPEEGLLRLADAKSWGKLERPEDQEHVDEVIRRAFITG